MGNPVRVGSGEQASCNLLKENHDNFEYSLHGSSCWKGTVGSPEPHLMGIKDRIQVLLRELK